MKSQYKYLLVCTLMMVVLSSCTDFFETTLTLDPPPFEKKLVIIAEAKAGDSTIQIKIAENFGILDDKKDTMVVNPQLTFSVNGIEQTGKTYNKGLFIIKLNGPLKAGQKCDIQASHAGFKPIFATQTVPALLPLKTLKFVENGGITPDGDTRSKVDVSFTDSLGKDFYEVVVLTRYGKDQPFRSTYTSVNEPGSVESARASGVLFGDQSFDGQDKTMSFQFYRITEQQAKGNIQLRWRNVSESYFKYSKTANVHFESRDNPFATPSDIFTNIEGGLGYFFLHNQRTYKVH